MVDKNCYTLNVGVHINITAVVSVLLMKKELNYELLVFTITFGPVGTFVPQVP